MASLVDDFSFILMTLMLDSEVTLLGEIKYYLLPGVKELNKFSVVRVLTITCWAERISEFLPNL